MSTTPNCASSIINEIGDQASDLMGLGRALLLIAENADKTDLVREPALKALAWAIEGAAAKIEVLAEQLPTGGGGQ